MKHTHADRLERWLGADQVSGITHAMREFYWPVAVAGVPGAVHAMPGGDFTGEILGGQEASAFDRARDAQGRLRRELQAKMARQTIWQSDRLRRQVDRRYYAFSSLGELLTAASTGKRDNLFFSKSAQGQLGVSTDFWLGTGLPAQGATGVAAPAGSAPDKSTTGAIAFRNPSSANSAHFAGAAISASFGINSVLLYDRLFSVAKTMNSTATEAVTGVPTRYTSTSPTNVGYIGGNFCFPLTAQAVSNVAHNWTVCTYTDQGGNASTFPSATGIAGGTLGFIDLGTGGWFMPLEAGDYGVGTLTQMQCSALVPLGKFDFVIGHPIAFLPCPVANLACKVDGIASGLNLARILDDACLALLETTKAATTSTTYTGQIVTVSE